MIRCTKCGTINKPDETFCIECNSYLEWNSEPVEDEAPPASANPPPSPAPVAPPPPFVPPPPYVPPPGTPPPGTPPPAVPPPHPLVPPPPPRSSPTAQLPAEAAAPEAPFAAPEAPSAAPEAPPARKPSAAPAEPRARKPEKGAAAPTPKPKAAEAPKVEKIKPGDRICPNCGSGNDPTRKFCRRCGHSLLEAVVQPEPEPEHVPWYRRIFGRRRAAETYDAGERPASMTRGSRPRRRFRVPNVRATVIGFMVLLGLGAYASYLYVPDVTTRADDVIRMVRERFTAPAPVVPVSFEGAAARGHAAGDAFDSDNSATYWLSPGGADRPDLFVFFQDAVDLRRIEVMGGAPGDEYGSFGRPRTIALRTQGGSQQITLADTPDVQPFDIDLRVPDGEALRIVVLDTFAGRGNDGVAIRNLVFGASS